MAKTADFESENPGSSPGAAASPPPPLCVFCGKPWTDEMLKVFAEADIEHGYYEGDYSVVGYDVSIDVTCSSCKRLVYRKELRVR